MKHRFFARRGDGATSIRFALKLVEVFGRGKDIGECLAVNNSAPILGYKLTRLNEVDRVVSVTPAE